MHCYLFDSFRWKLLRTICGYERMVDYIKNCVQQHVRYQLASIVRRTHRVRMHHMWVIRLLIDGDHFQRLAGIVCDCDRRWVQIIQFTEMTTVYHENIHKFFPSKLNNETFTQFFSSLYFANIFSNFLHYSSSNSSNSKYFAFSVLHFRFVYILFLSNIRFHLQFFF